VARLHERVVVDVRCVDLHAPAELLDAELLGEDDREGVGLLAGRATGGPRANRRVGPAARDDPRHDVA
jgi:hypothetical protein